MSVRKLTFAAVWLLLTVVPVFAQSLCPEIVDTALDAVDDNCADMGRNTACYGYDRVDSLFAVQQPASFFSQPSDRTDLLHLNTLKTYPLDTAAGRFGVAVMNIQANIPEALPGQTVVFLLLGESGVTNAVDPDEVAQPVPAVEVTAAADTSLFSLPSANSSTRAAISAGTALSADGFNDARDWLRVVANDDAGWVSIDAVLPDAALESLPTLDTAARTPMQAFYFDTGLSNPECHQAEATVAVQSPQNLTVDLTVNGVEIQVGSLVTFTQYTLTVHRGHVVTSLGQAVNASQTIELNRDSEDNFVSIERLRPINALECERGHRVQEALNNMAETNTWEPQEVPPCTTQPPGTEEPDDGAIVHIVQPGESLYSIATLHEASMPEIARVNNLTDPFIVTVGQELRVPDPGSGFVNLPLRPVSQTVRVVESPVQKPESAPDCAALRLLSGGERIISTFAWTPVPGADEYKVNFYGSDGSFVTSMFVRAPATSVDVNMGDLGTGAYFRWQVEALQSGSTLCSALSGVLPKPIYTPPTPAPGGPALVGLPALPAAPVFTAFRVCDLTPGFFPAHADITWANSPAGAAITISAVDETPGPPGNWFPPSAPAGTFNIGILGGDLGTITVTSTPGGVVILPGC